LSCISSSVPERRTTIVRVIITSKKTKVLSLLQHQKTTYYKIKTKFIPLFAVEGNFFLARPMTAAWSEAERLSHPDSFSTCVYGDNSKKQLAWFHAKPLAPWPSGLMDIRT
jgi:hypothetical protein